MHSLKDLNLRLFEHAELIAKAGCVFPEVWHWNREKVKQLQELDKNLVDDIKEMQKQNVSMFRRHSPHIFTLMDDVNILYKELQNMLKEKSPGLGQQQKEKQIIVDLIKHIQLTVKEYFRSGLTLGVSPIFLKYFNKYFQDMLAIERAIMNRSKKRYGNDNFEEFEMDVLYHFDPWIKQEKDWKALVRLLLFIGTDRNKMKILLLFGELPFSFKNRFMDFFYLLMELSPADFLNLLKRYRTLAGIHAKPAREIVMLTRLMKNFRLAPQENPSEQVKQEIIVAYNFLIAATGGRSKVDKVQKHVSKLSHFDPRIRKATIKELIKIFMPHLIKYLDTVTHDHLFKNWVFLAGEPLKPKIFKKYKNDLVFAFHVCSSYSDGKGPVELLRAIGKGDFYPEKKIPFCFPYNHPKNLDFINKMHSKGVNMDPWLRGFEKHYSVKDHELTIVMQLNPLEELQFAELTGGCLSLDGGAPNLAIPLATDVNKRVLLIKENGKPLANTVIALNNHGKIVSYYIRYIRKLHGITFAEQFEDYVNELVKKCNTSRDSERNIEPMFEEKWVMNNAEGRLSYF